MPFADDVKAADVRAACERKGLLVLTAKTRLRLLPPLILSEADVAKALAILDDVLSSMAEGGHFMENLLKMSDLSPAELTHILDVADQQADCTKQALHPRICWGKKPLP